jgi:uncharacterized membrane protein
VAVSAAVAASVLSLGVPVHSVALVAAGAFHTAAYASLLLWFAASLRLGQQPVITGFARRMRRTMPDEVVRYTRHATIAWCVFFTAQLAISAALLGGAPITVWSSFVNLWNAPLVVAMVLAEYACRWFMFPREQRTGLVATLTGLRQMRTSPNGSP